MKFIKFLILSFIYFELILQCTCLKEKAKTTHQEEVVLSFIKSDRFTPFNDDGRGSIFYLDRHNVDCGNNAAINRFTVQRQGGNRVRYAYKCVTTKNISSTCVNKQTNPNESAGNDRSSLDYLDRHQLTCDPGHVLKSFKLGRKGGREIFYQYTCCQAKLAKSFVEKTGESDKGNMSIIYLDRQTVDARDYNVISSLKFNTHNGRNHYVYTANTLLV